MSEDQSNIDIQHGWVKIGDIRFRPDQVSYYEKDTIFTTKALISGNMIVIEMTVEQMDDIMAKVTRVIIGERV